MALPFPVSLPGREQVAFHHEVECCPHRLVVRPDDPGVARDQFRERDGFRGLHRDVEAGPVLALAVTDAPERDLRSGHRAGEDRLEAGGGDVGPEAERCRTASVPPARFRSGVDGVRRGIRFWGVVVSFLIALGAAAEIRRLVALWWGLSG